MSIKSSVRRTVLVLTLLGSIFVGGFWAGKATAEPVDYQRQMRSALTNLRQAKLDLQQVPSPMAGHRANAIRPTEQAIAEGEAGIAFDDKEQTPSN